MIQQNITTAYPSEIMPWIVTDEFVARLEKIKVKYGLQDNEEYSRVIQSVLKKQIPLKALPQTIRTTLFVTNDESKLIARDIIGWLILPVAYVYDEYETFDLLESFGGKETDFPFPQNIDAIQNKIADVIEGMYIDKILEDLESEEQTTPTPSPETTSDPQQQAQQIKALQQKLADQYSASKTDAITKRQQDFEKEFTQDKQTFKKHLYQAINDRDATAVIAALWVLAEQGKLRHILTEDTTIRDLLSKHLHNKYSDAVATHFDTHADEPVYIAYFLRHLLIDTLKMSEHEAGALVIHLVNEYNRATNENFDMLAYGDIEQQSFVWRDITEEQGRLVLAE